MIKNLISTFAYAIFTYLIVGYLLVQASPETDNQQRRINIDITSHLGDNQTYIKGDAISLYISLDSDAYVLLIYQDADGNLTQILPNTLSNNHFFKAGDFISVPNSNSPFKFTISKPFGEEHFWAFAADNPFPALRGVQLNNGFILLKDKLDTITTALIQHSRKKNGYFGHTKSTIVTKIAEQ